VDGGTVTPKFQGGAAFSAGNASGIDSYSFTAIKTAGTTFTVLASQTQFK
jgi:predicted Rossmann fold nucleotide-binding protein DprA/Smf involved in DNA uptake